MAEKGRLLEVLMAKLQSHLSPEGVKVKLREKFFNKKTGKPIGEIDITVRGDFGTSKFFWGIECRDRPASGPQGLTWIREIVGKKQQLQTDKMIAVSSTGFTEDAEDFARSENIDLLSISEPDEIILKDWFEVLEISYTEWKIDIKSPIRVNLRDQTRETPTAVSRISGSDPVFIIPPLDMRPQSLDSLVSAKVESQLPFPSTEEPIREMAVEIRPPLSLLFDGAQYPLRNAEARVDVTHETQMVKALFNVCHRLSDKENIALTGTARIKVRGRMITFLATVKKSVSGDGSMDMRIHYLDERGNETNLPEGFRLGMTYE